MSIVDISTRRGSASWVVRNRLTREVIFETFNPALVRALNAAKYEAMPILDYLGEVNKAIRESRNA